MKIFRFLPLILVLCALSAARPEDHTSSGGLDRVLRGARIGVVFSDVVVRHPEAVYSDAELRDTPVTTEATGALLISHDADPFLGLNAFANIGFKDETLYEMVVVWTGDGDATHARRRRFFTAAIQHHGHVYVRETILVRPHTLEERPVAVLLWQDAEAVTLAFYTAPSPLEPHPRGALTYAQFTPGDPFLNDILEKHPADTTQREQAWAEMEDVLPLLETLE